MPETAKKSYVKAFPNPGFTEGMDLRDYFAANALQACLSGLNLINVIAVMWHEDVPDAVMWHEDVPEQAAKRSYEIADAMMKARNE